jgi:hypothetical protein
MFTCNHKKKVTKPLCKSAESTGLCKRTTDKTVKRKSHDRLSTPQKETTNSHFTDGTQLLLCHKQPNNRYQHSENPYAVHYTLLHDLKD